MNTQSGRVLQVPAERIQLATIRDFVEAQAEQYQVAKEDIDDLIQAVDEAATNIIIHGYQERPGKIELEFRFENCEVQLILRDQATPFDPRKVPPPDLTLPLHKRKAGGLGVHLIRKCVDEIEYRSPSEGGNELVLVKNVKINRSTNSSSVC